MKRKFMGFALLKLALKSRKLLINIRNSFIDFAVFLRTIDDFMQDGNFYIIHISYFITFSLNTLFLHVIKILFFCIKFICIH